MNTEYIPRNTNEKIDNYINETIQQMDSLEYEIEGFFDKNDLISILIKDLPVSKDEESKLSLIQDICKISADFFDKTKSKFIKIQFKVVTDNMCRLFHVDNNIQRLLCTYHGQGTQWLDENNINRKALGHGDNNKIVKDISKIRSASSFDILLLKGERFLNGSIGAVHRSPPLKSQEQKRFLLKIDEC